MSFNQLFSAFTSGTPIKRKSWGGYWVYNNGRIQIHTKTGEILDLQDTKDVLFTISHILQSDWEIATNENCDVVVN